MLPDCWMLHLCTESACPAEDQTCVARHEPVSSGVDMSHVTLTGAYLRHPVQAAVWLCAAYRLAHSAAPCHTTRPHSQPAGQVQFASSTRKDPVVHQTLVQWHCSVKRAQVAATEDSSSPGQLACAREGGSAFVGGRMGTGSSIQAAHHAAGAQGPGWGRGRPLKVWPPLCICKRQQVYQQCCHSNQASTGPGKRRGLRHMQGSTSGDPRACVAPAELFGL